MTDIDPFEDKARPSATDQFVVDLGEFEGPLDLLLTLARDQKVDLTRISILRLAEQYVSFISGARRMRLEVAADYLVMAAWLAYLKSRLLLPHRDDEDEPTGEELAARLQFQLLRLQAMREAVEELMARPRSGIDVFRRGMPEGVRVLRHTAWECSMYELLKAYADQTVRSNVTHLTFAPRRTFSPDEAMVRLIGWLGDLPDWASLETFLPSELRNAFERRSAVASTLSASLELVRTGKVQLRQSQHFGPIFLKSVEAE